ncbi:ORFL61W [Human betaherpesvirus 5]|nr:ORFL61W [Human betaherpesvirus 5]QHX40367.1 ORFL61W [Human betaherpesvirus 5]
MTLQSLISLQSYSRIVETRMTL